MKPILTLQWHSNIRTSKELMNCSVNLRPQSLSLFAVQHHYILFLPKTIFYMWFCHLCSVEYLNLLICSNQFSIMVYWWEWEVTPSLTFLFWLGHLEKPLCYSLSFARFSFSCAWAFLTPALHNHTLSLCSSQITCLNFHCLCICFLPFSLISLSLLSHADLLPAFLLLGISSSCVL